MPLTVWPTAELVVAPSEWKRDVFESCIADHYSLIKDSQTRVGNVLLVFGSRPKGSIELKETEVIDVSRYPDPGVRI